MNLMRYELRADDPHYRLVDIGRDYDSVLRYQIKGSRAYAICVHQNHPNHYPNLIFMQHLPLISLPSTFLNN
ncbi:unnamed protein product [Eruca vesicaria subsp. sativa]|uniref:Uncharacterized protein n=1 Tax=Eruca vesicaria subsp. sativa TaxID=29727 RepID=A0ABC8KRC4_ERUVS|nr:unnamed protein product [Eruca vesicaria subsp. sativa]